MGSLLSDVTYRFVDLIHVTSEDSTLEMTQEYTETESSKLLHYESRPQPLLLTLMVFLGNGGVKRVSEVRGVVFLELISITTTSLGTVPRQRGGRKWAWTMVIGQSVSVEKRAKC